MKRFLGYTLQSFIAIVTFIVIQQVISAASWEGIYRVEGRNPNGTTYTGALWIEKVPETSFYMLTWQMDADVKAEHIMAAFAYEHGGMLITTGANMFMLGSFKKDGGLWMVPNQNLTAPLTEKWEPSKAKTLEEALKPVKPAAHPPTSGRPTIQA